MMHNTYIIKYRGELMCFGWLTGSCSTCGSCRIVHSNGQSTVNDVRKAETDYGNAKISRIIYDKNEDI